MRLILRFVEEKGVGIHLVSLALATFEPAGSTPTGKPNLPSVYAQFHVANNSTNVLRCHDYL